MKGEPSLQPIPSNASFVAIDFETADEAPDSACAVGIVRVVNNVITERAYRLICPPRPHFFYTHVHGITWDMVRREPSFREVWPELEHLLRGVHFLAAHNASFDSAVLRACCEAAGLPVPAIPFQCTVRIARNVLGIRPAKLNNVCARLGIELRHHQAGSDAEACARIVLAGRSISKLR